MDRHGTTKRSTVTPSAPSGYSSCTQLICGCDQSPIVSRVGPLVLAEPAEARDLVKEIVMMRCLQMSTSSSRLARVNHVVRTAPDVQSDGSRPLGDFELAGPRSDQGLPLALRVTARVWGRSEFKERGPIWAGGRTRRKRAALKAACLLQDCKLLHLLTPYSFDDLIR